MQLFLLHPPPAWIYITEKVLSLYRLSKHSYFFVVAVTNHGNFLTKWWKMQVWGLVHLSTASVFSSVIALTLSRYPSFWTQSLDQVLLLSCCYTVICCKQGTGVNGQTRREHRPVTVIDSNNSGISNFNSTQLTCKSDKSLHGLYSTVRKEWLRIPHETQSSYLLFSSKDSFVNVYISTNTEMHT